MKFAFNILWSTIITILFLICFIPIFVINILLLILSVVFAIIGTVLIYPGRLIKVLSNITYILSTKLANGTSTVLKNISKK